MNTKDKERAKFPASSRLHSSYEYESIIREKPFSRGAFFSVNVSLHELTEEKHKTSRIGLVFSKKMAKTAIVRNSLKRVAREYFRNNMSIIPKGDYVLRLKSPIPKCSLRILKKNAWREINYHFNKISKCIKK